jgi:hypothetical protein
MELDNWFFGGGDKIDSSDLAKGEVINVGDGVDKALKNFRWGYQSIGCIVLQLSPDNRRIVAGEFTARGDLDKRELRVEAASLWPDADDNVTLVIKTPRADIFRFSEGGLWSDLVDGTELEAAHVSHEEDGQTRTIAAADLDSAGIGSFCIRMVCQLSKQSSQTKGLLAKYTLLAFPKSKQEALQEGPHAKLGSFPGLKLAEGDLPLGPAPTVAWKCPMVPLTLPGTAYEELAMAPAAERLRGAIGAIMAKATAPEICKTAATLAAKWEKLRRSPAEAALKTPQISWPAGPRQQEAQGKGKKFFSCFCFFFGNGGFSNTLLRRIFL